MQRWKLLRTKLRTEIRSTKIWPAVGRDCFSQIIGRGCGSAIMLAGSARIFCAGSSTVSHRASLGRLVLPPQHRPLPSTVSPRCRLGCAATGEEPSVGPAIEKPASRSNGDPGATTSSSSGNSSTPAQGTAAGPPSAHGSTEEQLSALRMELQKVRKALGTQSAASQQQFLSINSLERQAQGRAATPQPRTHLPSGGLFRFPPMIQLSYGFAYGGG